MTQKLLLILLAIFLLLVVPTVIANDETVVNQQTTLWADILDGATFYSVTSANITVYNAQTQIVVNNQAMTNFATGRYYYNYTPNTTGIFYTYTTFQNASGLVATASSTFYVAENAEMYLTLLFGLLSLIVLCFWYARSMASKPTTAVNVWIFEQVTTKDFSVIFDIIGAFLIMPLLALLQIWSTGTQYATIFSSIYTVGLYFIGFTIFGYLVFYLIYRYNEGIENINNNAHGKKRR